MRWVLSTVIAIAMASNPAASYGAIPVPDGSPASVEAPNWQVGSSWEYSDGYGLRVHSSGSGVTTFERLDAAGQWFSMRGFLRQDAASATAERQTVFRTAPPTTGDQLSSAQPLTFQREYLSNGQLVVHATSWTVEGRERITVPAGTFDCWVIVWRARSLKSDWTGFERWWYSPEAQNYVRLEYKYGAIPTASRVLMRYNLSAGGATAAAPDPAALQPTPEEAPQVDTNAVEIANLAQPVLPPVVPPEAEPEVVLRPTSVVTGNESRTIAKEPAPASGHWFVQIAAVSDEMAAKTELFALGERIADLPNGIEKADLGERGIYYRVWLGNYDQASAADVLCRDLKAAGHQCFVRRR